MSFSLAMIVELFAKSTAVVVLARLILSVWRGASAAQRHLVWITALGAVLLVMPASVLLPTSWRVSLRAQGPNVAAAVHPGGGEPIIATETVAMAQPGQVSVRSVTSAASVFVSAAHARTAFYWPAVALAVWGGGAALLLGYRILGSQRLRVLKRSSAPLEDDRIHACLSMVVTEMQIVRPIDLRVSAQCKVPVTWGSLRPVLMLPKEALKWSAERITAALRHEAGHIRRLDYLTRWLAQIACALYWPNPLVWMAAKSLRAAQEQACDDLVLCAGTTAEDYAAQLFESARTLAREGFIAHCAVAMARPSTLEGRVLAIVDGKRNRQPSSRPGIVLAGVLAGLILAISSAITLQAGDKVPVAATVADSARVNAAKPTADELEVSRITTQNKASHKEENRKAREVVEVLASDNPQLIAEVIRFPLARGESLPAVKDRAAFIKSYPVIFDEALKAAIKAERKLAKQPSYGPIESWRSAWICAGKVRFDGESVVSISLSGTEMGLRKKAIEELRLGLHPSLRNFTAPYLEGKTKQYLVRVDKVGDELRLALWAKGKSLKDKPDKIVTGGVLGEQGGTLSIRVITFTAVSWSCVLDLDNPDANGPPGYLSIKEPGKDPLHQGLIYNH